MTSVERAYQSINKLVIYMVSHFQETNLDTLCSQETLECCQQAVTAYYND
jgi:hypothetical protein